MSCLNLSGNSSSLGGTVGLDFGETVGLVFGTTAGAELFIVPLFIKLAATPFANS